MAGRARGFAMDRGASEDVPVLIVGGSLVGLSAALFLRHHGVDVLAVERHAGTAINARAGHFHLRTVEILRSAGIEGAVRRKSEEQYPPDGGINNVESLAGREIANYFPNLNAGVDEFSPTVRLFINQDALEPILRTRAAELGARLRYGAECMSLSQDADGVTAVIRDHGLLSHSVTIYFRALADLGPLLADRNQGVHYVTNPLMRRFFRLDRSGNAGFLVVNLCRGEGEEGSAHGNRLSRYTIGSLLRPQYLKLAREQSEAGQLEPAAYKEIEDRAVDQVIAMQEGVGLDVVTDGEEAAELARLGCRYIQVDAPDFGQLVDPSQRESWERAGLSVDRVFSEGADMLNELATVPGVSFGLHLCRAEVAARVWG